jgi:predicted outer membrane repeat protein
MMVSMKHVYSLILALLVSTKGDATTIERRDSTVSPPLVRRRRRRQVVHVSQEHTKTAEDKHRRRSRDGMYSAPFSTTRSLWDAQALSQEWGNGFAWSTLEEQQQSMSMSMPSQPPPPDNDCTTLSTTEALRNAIIDANGEILRLCSTTISFQQQLEFSNVATTTAVKLVCDGTCIFDGSNTTRLFSFGSSDFPQVFPVDYQLYFEGFTFQRGVVRDTSNGGDGSTPHGGSMLLVGLDSSEALFANCIFRENLALLENGGAIYAINGGNLEFDNCLFERNYAYNGGAISASDVQIRIADTRFIDNTAVGGFEGAAIYVDSSDLNNQKGMVTCTGAGNVFEGNVELPDIVGPTENCEGSAVLPSN